MANQLALVMSDANPAQLRQILSKPHQMRVSWTGIVEISIEGYVGAAAVSNIVMHYLESRAFNLPSYAASVHGPYSYWGPYIMHDSFSYNKVTLEERIECYELWDKIQELYSKSVEELNKTWICKYIRRIPSISIAGILINPLLVSPDISPLIYLHAFEPAPKPLFHYWGMGATRNQVLWFNKSEFQQLWPKQEPIRKFHVILPAQRIIPHATLDKIQDLFPNMVFAHRSKHSTYTVDLEHIDRAEEQWLATIEMVREAFARSHSDNED